VVGVARVQAQRLRAQIKYDFIPQAAGAEDHARLHWPGHTAAGEAMDIDELDLRKLRAFHLVVKLGSLRRAAIRLNITVPAVSLSIRRLEHQLGMPLFQRRPNRMILTPAGARLAQGVELILREVHTVFNPIASEAALQGRFRLAINSDLVWYFVPRIAAFIKANPEVELGRRHQELVGGAGRASARRHRHCNRAL